MPTRPTVKKMTATSADVLNAIRNSASVNYRDYVPIATQDAESVKEIGNVIMQYPTLQNEFLSNLVNRIGRVIITSKMYSNPLQMFKKGVLDFGESIEELFVDLAKPQEYDAEVAESKVFKREIPDVRAAFHVMNFQKFYKVTIQQNDLKLAFLSWSGVDDLIAKITDSLYTSLAYDEFTITKYLLAKKILNGELYPIDVESGTTEAGLKANAATMRATSNNLTFMSNKYNLVGVHTHTLRDNQYILINSAYDASMDVEVLASAFNMSKAEFLGHRVLVDGFGNFDTDRLNQLFTDDGGDYVNNYTPLTSAQLTALETIPAVLVDIDFFMLFDVLDEFTEQYNAQGLYWNYFLHHWEVFSSSPFSNAIVFTPTTPAVTSVNVSPSTATVTKGQSIQLTATVNTNGFASKAVNWSTNSTYATVGSSGLVEIASNAPSTNTSQGTNYITVTATSVFDSTKTDTCQLTIV